VRRRAAHPELIGDIGDAYHWVLGGEAPQH
jgi:hypothetical protein